MHRQEVSGTLRYKQLVAGTLTYRQLVPGTLRYREVVPGTLTYKKVIFTVPSEAAAASWYCSACCRAWLDWRPGGSRWPWGEG